METEPTDFDEFLKLSTLEDRPVKEAIQEIGVHVVAAWDAKRQDVLSHIVEILAATIDKSQMAPGDECLLQYFLANGWNGIKFLSSTDQGGGWKWESNPVEQETICWRKASRLEGLLQQPTFRVVEIHTNLANCYSTTGRFVEAIPEWNRALLIDPEHGMARGNRAMGLWTYAQYASHGCHAHLLAREAWLKLDPSGLKDLDTSASTSFAQIRAEIERTVPAEILTMSIDMDDFSLGDAEGEREYRQWCLAKTLFLNPLNDLGSRPIAARDNLTCPSIVAKIDEGPRFHDFMNQIKQEYCSARWMIYDATQEQPLHYSDREVLLVNTLDYPSYGLRTEQLKLGFRALYSLFDKIAFFLDDYMDLQIDEKRVSFSGLWYDNQERGKKLRKEFVNRQSLPLRGLFWLSKDLYEKNEEFRQAIDPVAERLYKVRNHLEHKFLKLHSDLWGGPDSNHFTDGLALSLGRDEFEEMTMHLLSLVRAAIIYLVLGVHQEERVRASQRDPNEITPPAFLDNWEDDWKS